jgi:hypothetical protein
MSLLLPPPQPFAFIVSLWKHPAVSKKNMPMIPVDKMRIIKDIGIEGIFPGTHDHRPSSQKEPDEDSRRQICIIFQCTVDEVEDILGARGAFDDNKVRSNMILQLNPKYEGKFDIYNFTNRMKGEVIIISDVKSGAKMMLQDPRRPCNFMNKVLPGSKVQMENGHQGLFSSAYKTGEFKSEDGLWFESEVEAWIAKTTATVPATSIDETRSQEEANIVKGT